MGMIHRTDFVRRCQAAGFVAHHHIDPVFWRLPINYVLWWDDEQVLILPNNIGALALGNRRPSAVAIFDDLDAAIATYHLLNP